MPEITLEDKPAIRFPKSQSVEIPFRRGYSHVLIEVQDSEGRPNTFFLDTGASYSIVTSRFAGRTVERENSPTIGGVVGHDGELPFDPTLVDVLDLSVGGLKLERFGAMRMDFPGLDEFFGFDVHGILGFNVLRHWITEVDYRRERVSLVDPRATNRVDEAAPKFRIPFTLHAGAMIRMEGQINGKATSFVLDIGCSNTILNGLAGDASGIEWTPDPDVAGDATIESPRVDVGIAECLVVGTLAVVRPKVWRNDMPPFASIGLADEPAAFLGNDLLAKFRVAIDYEMCELRLWNGV